MSAFQYFSFSPLTLLPLAWLWFRLIDHLRVEWSVNPQYAYGWAVPFLCLYLLWRKAESRKQKVESRGGKAERLKSLERRTVVSDQWSVVSGPGFSFSAFRLFSFCLLAFLYLPTRLIQEANPEWRLVSWALAFEVIGITLLLLRTIDYGPRSTDTAAKTTDHGPRTTDTGARTTEHGARSTDRGPQTTDRASRPRFQLSAFSFSDFVFPLCFFFVAVPWPTFVEGPLIQGLMRANVGATVELLGAVGIPAMQHGNIIELSTGVVGIDDACSGIRSFQATLMISLFLGGLYALSVKRRALCVLAGFAFAFVFNVGRTLLLAWVASAKGVGAVASWHDPAGVTILVACFVSLWLIARAFQKAESRKQKGESGGQRAESGGQWSVVSGQGAVAPPSPAPVQSSGFEVQGSRFKTPPPSALDPASCSVVRFPLSAFPISALTGRFSICLAAWLLLVEGGTGLWYRIQESRLPKPVAWDVAFPRDNPTFHESALPEAATRLLRQDQGISASWTGAGQLRWQVVFLHWSPGRVAGYLAKLHTPQICMPAAGFTLKSFSDIQFIPVQGLRLPFRSYVFERDGYTTHVFYCRWQDRPTKLVSVGEDSSRAARLRSVWTGRGNCGQRVLEVALSGITDQQEAESALAHELDKLIKVER